MKETIVHGLPHIGAHYVEGWHRGRRNYVRDVDACPICDQARATDVHHLDPIGMGGKQMPVNLVTAWGTFPLYTPLIACCRACRRRFHLYEIQPEWYWDDEESAERWHDGWFLSHGFVDHDEMLNECGGWYIDGRKL